LVLHRNFCFKQLVSELSIFFALAFDLRVHWALLS
jgi:hypothetical protein